MNSDKFRRIVDQQAADIKHNLEGCLLMGELVDPNDFNAMLVAAFNYGLYGLKGIHKPIDAVNNRDVAYTVES